MTTILEHLQAKNKLSKNPDEFHYIDADYVDAFFDCDLLVWEAVGSYQGDFFGLIKRKEDGHLGFIVIAYGSCSG